jgi:dipeptidyl aminopeptidase/acylaminoacyl peptidase
MTNAASILVLLAMLWCCTRTAAATTGQDSLLPPLEHFFAESSRFSECLSPDGNQVAYLGPDHRGVNCLWVVTIGESLAPKKVSLSDGTAVTAFFWIGSHSLLWQTRQPSRTPRLYLRDLEASTVRQVLANEERLMRLEGVVDSAEPCILVGLSDGPSAFPDLYRVRLADHDAPERVAINSHEIITWAWDGSGSPVAGLRWTAEGAKEIVDFHHSPGTVIFRAKPEDDARLLSASADGSQLFVLTNRASDLTRIETVDPRTGYAQTMAADPLGKVDVEQVLSHGGDVLAVGFSGAPLRWQATDQEFSKLMEALRNLPEFSSMSCFAVDRTRNRCLLRRVSNSAPGTVYLYDREINDLRLLWNEHPEINPASLCKTKEISYPARDGTRIPAYLTTPRAGTAPWPLVVFPHGGPRMRTYPGYDGRVQFLASRGYAVLQPNFRGSRGYGKAFMDAGDQQWGKGVMQTDVTDGVDFLVKTRKADQSRIAILGGSYGGYAALAGLAFTPDRYVAGICLFGISDLIDYTTHFSVESQPYAGDTVRRLGDPSTAAGRARLEELSPLHHAPKFKAPLLIYHGAKDTLIPPSHAQRMAAALKKSNKVVNLLIAPDEAHGFSQPESEIAVYHAIELFLREHLGGSVGPPPSNAIHCRLVEWRKAACQSLQETN